MAILKKRTGRRAPAKEYEVVVADDVLIADEDNRVLILDFGDYRVVLNDRDVNLMYIWMKGFK